ncbi:glycosyl hydrolase family 88 [Flavobacterium sp. Sd200]|uniref:glycoside hydrolase family 88/105 protein n=1 Tax=Flavobacterium sp. Sd200 TaxID=2692211 RepID=UPI001370FC30|nr:glycoside hydrolase family 88 protein [Flavobacterium sp. Sd200]MXN90739.1 glycosyl hydrolase family 88 [Flavobacterium sp. Sd200]
MKVKNKVVNTIMVCLFFVTATMQAQKDDGKVNSKWSEKKAASIMKRYPQAWQIDGVDKPKWEYKPTFVLVAFNDLYKQTKNVKYYNYIKEYLDTFVDSTGAISQYNLSDYNIDYVSPGRLLFDLYKSTKDARYLKAMQLLKSQIDGQPRTPSGGFWHKKIYPDQMWLDGIYMHAPFYTKYTIAFENGKGLDDIAKQFELLHDHAFDPKTGLPYHAWDESKQIGWANKETGTSPTIWARGIGWYILALTDVLDDFPKDHPKYKQLISYLNEVATALEKQQDKSGLWYQITDKAATDGNYLEASGSAMFSYALAKGVNNGYLPKRFKKTANKAFDGILKNLITTDPNGEVHLSEISASIGLGGKPFRDGSNAYYANAKKSIDNSIGVGAFIMAAIELKR